MTVGGFDGPNDPRMKAAAEQLSKDKRFDIRSATGSAKLHFIQPMLALEVPRP